MPNSGVLYLGESYAEVGLVTDGRLGASRRWYLGREPLGRALTQFLNDQSPKPLNQLVVATKSLRSVLRRRHGTQPAFLVTSGFEHWLSMSRPVRQNHFTVQAERTQDLVDTSLVFGLSERVGPDGRVEKAVENADLEFLAAKLKLHNVTEVAIGLIHAGKNPVHEQQAGQFLRDQGFKVHLSSNSANSEYEVARWWAAIANAYLETAFNEMITEIRSSLQATGHDSAEVLVLGSDRAYKPEEPMAPIKSLFGTVLALHKWRQSRGVQALMYFGVEDFLLLDGRWTDRPLWRADFGAVALTHPGFVRSDIQSTQGIEKGFYGMPTLSHHEVGFEPGPMCLGKGLVPQFFDVLYLLDRFEELPGLSERLNEKSRARISEALTAMARGGQTGHAPSPKQLAYEIEAEAAGRLVAQLNLETPETLIGGPLAEALRPSLERILTSLKMKPSWSTTSSLMMDALANWVSSTDESVSG